MEFTFSPAAQPEDIQTANPEKINRNFDRLFREIGRFHEWLRAYDISLTTDIAGVLPVANGGTGFSTYAIGDLLYADTTTSLAKRAAVASGSVLVSAGTNTAPVYSSSPSLTTSVTAPLLLGTTSTTTPLVIGGTGTASPLTLRATSGIGGINSYIFFQVGNNGATEAMRILDTGFVGIGNTGPTARLHLGAGTTALAPFKLVSGPLLTSPAVGAHEFLTDDYFVTITTGTARKALILDNGTRLISGRVPFATTNGRLVDDPDMTFSGSRLTVTDLTTTSAPIVSSLTPGRVVFAGVSKELVDDADLTFATDTLTATKVLAPTSVSTPSLISTGTMTIAPAAGTHLNFTVSGAGNFVVKSDDFVVNGSTGFIGFNYDPQASSAQITASQNTVVLPAPPAGTILHLGGADTQICRFLSDSFGNTGGCAFNFRMANGTAAAPSAILVNNAIAQLGGFAYGATAYSSTVRARITFNASETWTDTAQGTFIDLYTTANGAATAGGTTRLRIENSGNFGFGLTGATAVIHVKAGTATASTAPLKFTSGTLLTTAEAGAVEFLTDDFYGTITTGAARKKFVLDNGAALVSGRVPFVTTNGRLTDDADLTFATDTLTSTKVSTGTLLSTGVIRLKGYTVAALPAGTQGDTAFVTDALTPTFLVAVVGGGAAVSPVFYDGTNWVTY